MRVAAGLLFTLIIGGGTLLGVGGLVYLFEPAGKVDSRVNQYIPGFPWPLPKSLTEKRIMSFARIHADYGPAFLTLADGSTLALAAGSEISIKRLGSSRYSISPIGSIEYRKSGNTRHDIHLPNQQPLTVSEFGTRLLISVQRQENLATIRVATGQLNFSPYDVAAGHQVQLRLDTTTVIPSITAIEGTGSGRYFADLRGGPPGVIQLDRVQLVSPQPFDEIPIQSTASGLSRPNPHEFLFEWQEIPGITQYHFQISTDLRFHDIVHEEFINTHRISVAHSFRSGTYFWRVRPLAQDYLFSRFSKPRRFIIKE